MVYYIIIRGPLGCGKSTIAENVSRILNAKHISIDEILDQHHLTKDKEEGYISQKSFFKANEIATSEVKEAMDNGKNVIIDGNFYWKSQIDDLIEKLNANHFVFTLKASLKTCMQRDIERGETHGKEATEAVYKKSISFSHGTEIDTEEKSVDEVVKEILEKVKNG